MSDDQILMPRRLTAENGAKAALIGEFSVPSAQACPSCQGCDSDDCPRCDGEGVVPASILVSWTTIKAIYAAAVEHFHPAPTQCKSIELLAGE